jgi:hypothetical protein
LKILFYQNSQNWAALEKVKKRKIISDIKMLCENKLAINFDLEYLITEKVIEKHVIVDQNTTTVYYTVPPRFFGIFRLIELNSVLFDALRDDLYFHNINLQVAGVGGVKPIEKIGGSEKKLQAAVQALKKVFESERSFLNSVNPKLRS